MCNDCIGNRIVEPKPKHPRVLRDESVRDARATLISVTRQAEHLSILLAGVGSTNIIDSMALSLEALQILQQLVAAVEADVDAARMYHADVPKV